MLLSFAYGGIVWYFFCFCNQIKFDLIASAGHSPAHKVKHGKTGAGKDNDASRRYSLHALSA